MRANSRRVAKTLWWVATPWRLPQRLRFIRERAAREGEERELRAFVESERNRFADQQRQGTAPHSCIGLDLTDDIAVVDAAKLSPSDVFWPLEAPEAVVDQWSAARFCLGLLRARPDLYRRFPRALTDGAASEFVSWLHSEEGSSSGLTPAGLRHVVELFGQNLGARARQAFLGDEEIRSVLPHGLTPVGQRSLIHWFLRYARRANDLRLEEIWWLLLEAAEDPARELRQAYLFTPEWQRQFPDGLTVFGCEQFAAWFASTFGAAGTWVDPSTWLDWSEPATQLRIAYWANVTWQHAHPDALSDARRARRLIDWLATVEVGLSELARRWCERLEPESVASAIAALGVNIVGHFCYPSGLRVSVESIVEGLAAVDVATSLRDLRTDARDDPHHASFDGLECHDITIVHTQPEPFFAEAYRRADLFERTPRSYRIAYWYWEFDSIPEAWIEHAKQVDEVWAATEFVACGLRKRLSKPVRTLFPGVKLATFTRREREYFGLDPSRYTFLFTFHMMSIMERKNPLGLIRAFKAAFSPNEPVSLVLKTSFGERHPHQIQELRAAAAESNITILDHVYSPDEVLSLMDACDAYVSLHRSEGLGLTMAEAMLMGKPVIATNFSGNVDFMDDSNSLLVPYELVKLGKPIPPYDANLEWAEPSIEHAAKAMRRVFDNQAWARELGAMAKASAEQSLSLEAAGRRIAGRLAEIRRARASTP